MAIAVQHGGDQCGEHSITMTTTWTESMDLRSSVVNKYCRLCCDRRESLDLSAVCACELGCPLVYACVREVQKKAKAKTVRARRLRRLKVQTSETTFICRVDTRTVATLSWLMIQPS